MTAPAAAARFTEVPGEPVLFSGLVPVPPDFFGLHYHPGSPPSAVVVTAPAVQARCWRNHDGGTGTQWLDIHKGPGRFDWALTDQMFAEYTGVQRMSCNWVLYGTPAWAASSTAKDPYGEPGGNSAPTSDEPAVEFVTALLRRYRGRIRQFEIWNEFNNTAGAIFWTGGVARLAAMARALHGAVRSVDPTVQVLSPSVTDNGRALADFLNAGDSRGGFGRQWVDGIACHPYRGYGWDDPRHDAGLELGAWIDGLRAQIRRGGLDPARTPVFITEIGYHWDPADPAITGSTPAQFARWAERSMLRAAMLGVQQWIGYRHDSAISDDTARLLIGNAGASPVVADALSRGRAALCGRHLLRISRTADGRLRVLTDLGQTIMG